MYYRGYSRQQENFLSSQFSPEAQSHSESSHSEEMNVGLSNEISFQVKSQMNIQKNE